MAAAVALNRNLANRISNRMIDPKESSARGNAGVVVKQIWGRFDSLTLGSYALKNPSVTYSVQEGKYDIPSRSEGRDGLLGLGFMVRFNMAVDYIDNALYIKPNEYFHTGASYYFDPEKDDIYKKHHPVSFQVVREK